MVLPVALPAVVIIVVARGLLADLGVVRVLGILGVVGILGSPVMLLISSLQGGESLTGGSAGIPGFSKEVLLKIQEFQAYVAP